MLHATLSCCMSRCALSPALLKTVQNSTLMDGGLLEWYVDGAGSASLSQSTTRSNSVQRLRHNFLTTIYAMGVAAQPPFDRCFILFHNLGWMMLESLSHLKNERTGLRADLFPYRLNPKLWSCLSCPHDLQLQHQ